MRSPSFPLVALAGLARLAAVAGALHPALAVAQETAAEPAAPAAAPAPAAEAAPAAAAPVAQVATQEPRFTLGKWMLQAHLDVGAEPHPGFVCSTANAATCTVVSFGVGGQLLWRGMVGLGLGLYVAQGSATLPGSSDQKALGDRISAPLSLAIRPLGSRLLTSGDTFVNRLLAGISVEVGPALEYRRSSGAGLPSCDIHPTQTTIGFHGGLSVDVPVLGSTRGGWLAVRLSGRMLVGPDAHLAPRPPMSTLGETACMSQVEIPGLATQLFAGLSYYL